MASLTTRWGRVKQMLDLIKANFRLDFGMAIHLFNMKIKPKILITLIDKLDALVGYTTSTFSGTLLFRVESFRRKVTYVYNKLPKTLILIPMLFNHEKT